MAYKTLSHKDSRYVKQIKCIYTAIKARKIKIFLSLIIDFFCKKEECIYTEDMHK